MAVKIRLARHGKTKRAYYRIVAADSQMKRSGRYLELLGTVDPLPEPPVVALKQDRVEHWLSVGAKPTATAAQWIEKMMPGQLRTLDEKRTAKVRAARKARKARAKGKAPAKKAAAKKTVKKAAKKTAKAKKSA
ncbi:MAG TPA: 30S ribosomal protein S16 [Oligoflexia bacterium]|nr:30S ribosomal protein S16 [Oligoflexia bacterium]